MNESTLKWVAAVFLCTTIIGGAASVYYINQFNTLKADYEATIRDLEEFNTLKADYEATVGDLEEFTILVNFLFDYGNGTITWHNNTRLAVGTDLMIATGVVADIDYTESEWGAFISTINGVGGDSGAWWLWHYYEKGWEMGQMGADQKILHDRDIVSWVYTMGG